MKQNLLLCLVLLLLTACYNPQQRIVISRAEMYPPDSLEGSLVRPYGVGYNFIVWTDSLMLVENRPMHWSEGADAASDSLWLLRVDPIVVAAAIVIPEDSIDSVWVKVARDQQTMGWLHESELLASVVPDDPVSQIIHYSSTRQVRWLLFVIVLAGTVLFSLVRRRRPFHCVFLNDITSAYPTVCMILIALATQLYHLIQQTEPQTWIHFYYYPTLTPYPQPLLLSLFLLCLWGLLVLGITIAGQAFRLLPSTDASCYLSTFLIACTAVHLFFLTIGRLLPLGWLAAVLFAFFAVRHYFRHVRVRYVCGHCGAPLRHLGTCPRCGTIND